MPDPILLENVSFAYRDSSVLKNVSFTVKEGEFAGIIGPNGGGKTTLLKLLMGFLKLEPGHGKVEIYGLLPASSRRQIAYVPQSLRFDRQFPISVLELVMSGRLSHLSWYGTFSKEDRDIAQDAMEKVGIDKFQHKSFGTLSGGQAQRALIARALASKPRLLLLDEPTASVDAEAESEIYQILKSLHGAITVVMVTHNLRAVIELVEKVVCVQQTATVLKPEEVCEHFALGLYHPPLANLQRTNKPVAP